MKEKIEDVGTRVKELRELSRVEPEEMAKYLRVPVETYKCYEEGKIDIPASVLFGIAQKFDVDMALLLTGDEPKMNIFTVTRSGEGSEVERRRQYKYQNLAPKFKHKKAEPFIVIVEPRKDRPVEYSHPGQEFNYVMEGTLRVTIHGQEIVLEKGDSLFFDSSYKHAVESLNDRPAKMLAIVM
ncbi:MAG: Cupin domain protein [Methanosaeta sp. PtaB.Bin039]|nr:MAG: Cupin domain protein [Methanosaeta sp. PtaB.Bin039]OPY46934.1 MAG: Cupin domain protein [Methanosaeta sp. PtaU1.Bin028]HOT06927.1 XRE family transcriptional regulator [Methanotrichaceae archaeon]HQI53804.1 XRE family transcriptional regulator [Methanothrix soehngenii]HQF16451.1 XRE family transcriptional regulator [Methanotrichaceae archaeon]